MNGRSKPKGLRYAATACLAVAVLVGSTWAPDTPGAAGKQPVVQAAAERGVAGMTPEQYFDRQEQLHARLTSMMPPRVDDKRVLVRLTPDEHASIEKQIPAGPGPLRIGLTKALTPAAGLAQGVGKTAPDGSYVWAMTITSEGAGGIRVHIENVNLPAGAELYFLNNAGEAYGPYTGRGPNGDGDFWTPSVSSESGVLTLTAPNEINRAPFRITGVGHIGSDFRRAVEQVGEGLCGNADCIIDATCFNVLAVADAKDAVARIEWVSGPWLYACSGGLLADTDTGTEIPYFLTANHCLSTDSEASSVEFLWFYRTSNCGDPCPDDALFPKTTGSTVKATGSAGDFTLLQLSSTPPSGVKYLGWNNAEIAYSAGADLYRISHPNAGAQVYTYHQVDSTGDECSVWPRGERIYSVDVEGATDGGSSGSPVLNIDSEVVGQLSGCCGYNCSDVCDSSSNWTVDGALAYYWDSVSQFLDPQPECEINSDCDDGLFCTGTETCLSGSCQSSGDPCTNGTVCNEATDSCDEPACDNDGTCEAGEDCNNCPNDCRQKTTGAPNSRYCCDGDLSDCGDTRCSEEGWGCFDSVCTEDADCDDGQFCNGDETCVGGSCQGGIDPCPGQGCDEGSDLCVDCGGNKAPCSNNSDCCSSRCKNGTCRGN